MHFFFFSELSSFFDFGLFLTFCNISVIIEDIDLKLGVSVHYLKSNPYYQGRQNYAPFST